MIKLLVEQILNEGRDAPLYHGTAWRCLEKILTENKLKAVSQLPFKNGIKNGVSVSRDYRTALQYSNESSGCIFVLNQRKISQRQKIIPLKWTNLLKKYDEYEYRNIVMSGLENVNDKEEFILGDVKNLYSNIISVNFSDEDLRYPILNQKTLSGMKKFINKINVKYPTNIKHTKYRSNSEFRDWLKGK